MKRTVLTIAASVLAVSVTPLLGGTAHADCAAPEVTVTPTAVGAGAPVTVTGKYFAATCNDVGEDPPRAEPATADITFIQDGRDVVLATVTASRNYRFRETVTIPRWATDGRARLLVDGARETVLDVSEPVVTAPPTTTAPTQLARTGTDAPVGPLAAIAITLIGVGALLARRPRTAR